MSRESGLKIEISEKPEENVFEISFGPILSLAKILCICGCKFKPLFPAMFNVRGHFHNLQRQIMMRMIMMMMMMIVMMMKRMMMFVMVMVVAFQLLEYQMVLWVSRFDTLGKLVSAHRAGVPTTPWWWVTPGRWVGAPLL